MNKFFTFDQNNSGGKFDVYLEEGISETVIIEAADYTQANDRAEEIGLYFDGCENGFDCECCGDRWSRAWEGEGYDIPSLYGEDIFEAQGGWFRKIAFVHYLNGEVKQVKLK